jgi:hypothetical protein
MRQVPACHRLEVQLEKARSERKNAKMFSTERKEARQKETAAKHALRTCQKEYKRRGGIVYTKGLARAAHDAGVKFGLKPNFHAHAGLFKADNVIRDYFKVSSNEAIMPAAKSFAKKHGLDEAAQQAAIICTLEAAQKGAKAGFIAAQAGLAVLDAVASVATVGGYAVVAPAVHAGVGASQAVSVSAIKTDIAKHEALYQAALEKLRARNEASSAKTDAEAEEESALTRVTEAKQRQKEALEQMALERPWYKHPAVMGSIVILTGAAIGYAFTRERA